MTDRIPPADGPELAPPIAEVTPTPELGVPLDVYPSPLPLDIPRELAATGGDDWLQWVVAAIILVIAGVALWIGDRK